ncbi:nicotinate-nucleotide adenylyltransferase [Lysobacter sp. GX 14042]|uniref:nicotinate-nucleotide adenylyltransferase n=1 Tax=Lysobacter sp. GX 14042 TaxID=2907155 RepID=UPI001F47DC56|nr:nicotinate-nucleotide adenylyltransferase [Lysobacter sp. GX 14042]MCE7033142.1 nicotinate-nucleotide adenylyltransferase [Lysobacter sp. GX 14042]
MPEAPAPLALFYGGTFDPFHCGHLAIARHARDRLGTVVRMMPASDPPHRPPPGASAQDRVRMLELALHGEPGLVPDLRELDRDTPSWTVETLRGIRAELGARAPVALLVGADSLHGLPGWREWRELFGLAHFVVAARPGLEADAGLAPELQAALGGRWVDAPQSLLQAPAGRVFRLEQPLHPGSATAVRRRIAAGEPWQSLVPPAVAGYIARHRLYATGRTR